MKTIKLISFIIIAVLFIASVYIWFDEIVGKPVGPAGVGIGVFILAIMLVAGLVTLVVLLKSPRLYFFTFLGLVATLFLYLGVLKIITMNKDRMIRIENTKDKEADKILDKAWLLLESPIKADELLKTITNNTEQINERKAALYLALSLKNKTYQASFTDAISKTPEKGCRVVNYLLENYKVNTEEELLSLFHVLDSYDKVVNLEYCIPRALEDNFTFEAFVEKKQYQTAIASLVFRDDVSLHKRLVKAQKIEDKGFREQAIRVVLNQDEIYYQSWNETYTVTDLAPIVLALKNEEEFSAYLVILEQKLSQALDKSKADVKVWKCYNNQPTQENFIAMQQLLGVEHSLIQLIPRHISEFYQNQEQEILKHGKDNYILYRNFLSQMEGDLEHIHAYTSEPYRIYSKGKLVHEGICNQYGYISYKAYGAKADDLIQIETGPTGRWEQRVGWVSLLSPWDCYKGMHGRLDAIGKPSSKGYTKERAKKAKILFDAYMDDKWCKKE